jgi:hypothetical protein
MRIQLPPGIFIRYRIPKKPESKKIKEKKKEPKLVYVLIKIKENKPISEEAKRIEEFLKERNLPFARIINSDEFTLMINVKKLFEKTSRVYIIELNDGISRWFYLTPSEERINFDKKDVLKIFILKKEDALEEILKRIASEKIKGKSKIERILDIVQLILGFSFFWIAYISEEGVGEAINYLPAIFALIALIQGLKRGYKEREWEID